MREFRTKVARQLLCLITQTLLSTNNSIFDGCTVFIIKRHLTRGNKISNANYLIKELKIVVQRNWNHIYILDAPQSKALKVTWLVQIYRSQKRWTFALKNKCDDLPKVFFYRCNFIKISISLFIQISEMWHSWLHLWLTPPSQKSRNIHTRANKRRIHALLTVRFKIVLKINNNWVAILFRV